MKTRTALFVLIAGMLMFSCGEQPKEKEDKDVADEVVSLSIIDILKDPYEYEGKTVSFDGIINHVCRHSGDKMRVNPKDNDDYSILVMLGDFINQFDTDFEGEAITCRGVLKTEIRDIDEPAEEEHEHAPGDHTCETTEEAIKKMEKLGIEPEIRAYIELESFEIK